MSKPSSNHGSAWGLAPETTSRYSKPGGEYGQQQPYQAGVYHTYSSYPPQSSPNPPPQHEAVASSQAAIQPTLSQAQQRYQPERPLIDFDSPPANAREFPAADPRNSRIPLSGTHLIRLVLVAGVALILIVLILTVLLLYNPEKSGSHKHNTNLELPPPHGAGLSTTPSGSRGGWGQFQYNFTTGSILEAIERHPESGSLTDVLSDFEYTDFLSHYDFCCRHPQSRMVCSSQDLLTDTDTRPFAAEINWNPSSEEVYLKFRVKSEALLGIDCWMYGNYIKS